VRPTSPRSAIAAAIYAVPATLLVVGADRFASVVPAGLLLVAASTLLVGCLVHRVRRAEARVERSLVEVARAERGRSLAAAVQVVGHDMKNVCMAIDACAEYLRREPSITPRARAVIADVSACSHRLAGVARDLMSRADVASDVAPVTDVDVARVVSECVRLLRVMARDSACDVDVSAKHVALARASRRDLEYALLNVLLNAVDANAGRGRIKVALGTEDEDIVVRVRDEGPGVPAELAERVFEPFFTTKGEAASGIGLCASRALLRQNGGDLRLSRIGEPGAEVELRLPRAS
jgi:two-component system C4-dicarboxylate transport sensor histidine kinase DctB